MSTIRYAPPFLPPSLPSFLPLSLLLYLTAFPSSLPPSLPPSLVQISFFDVRRFSSAEGCKRMTYKYEVRPPSLPPSLHPSFVSLPPSLPHHRVRLVEPVISTPISPYFPQKQNMTLPHPPLPPSLPPSLLPSSQVHDFTWSPAGDHWLVCGALKSGTGWLEVYTYPRQVRSPPPSLLPPLSPAPPSLPPCSAALMSLWRAGERNRLVRSLYVPTAGREGGREGGMAGGKEGGTGKSFGRKEMWLLNVKMTGSTRRAL